MNNLKSKIVFGFFFISGFTALVFEVVWAKQAGLIFGNTTLASAAVIAAYMSGLALGSFFFGRIADRSPRLSLFLYGCLEGGIGLFAICFPGLIYLLDPVYQAIYSATSQNFLLISAIRFFLSFLILLVPTFFMGGTLPLLCRVMAHDPDTMKENINRLYAMNLFGAMAGSFASGFFLISRLGLSGTSFSAAVCNLGIFFLVLVYSRFVSATERAAPSGQSLSKETSPAEEGLGRGRFALMSGLMLIHGFTAFVIQICWTRTTALMLGSSTYSFSAMLTTFLAGLGLGTWAVGLAAKKNKSISLAAVGFMEIAAGASVLLFIPVFEWLIYFFVRIFPFVKTSMNAVFFTEFLFCAIAMLVPTFLIGLVFPAAVYSLGKPKDIGRIVGSLYALDTLGGVLGSFIAAFYLISNLGVIGALHAASILSIVGGGAIVVLASDKEKRLKRLSQATVLAFFPGLFLFYPWDKYLFSSGAYIYASSWAQRARMGKGALQKALETASQILYYQDGISSTVTVRQQKSGRSKSLAVNGKVDASTTGDMETQFYSGFIPLLAHSDPKEVLVIGLGSGVTLGAVAAFPEAQNIECVEIEPAVIEANRFFVSENNHVLRDPRVRLIVGDGRNHIRYSRKKYDAIISEPSNPWISGVSSLFTRENYVSALEKLKPDGIYCQWLQAYQMSRSDFIMVMQTFVSVFPEVNLFHVSGADYLLLGSRKEISFDHKRVEGLIQENSYVQSILSSFGKYGKHFLLGSFLLSNRDLREGLSEEETRLNTDDFLYLEFNAPKHLYKATARGISRMLYYKQRRDIYPRLLNWDREETLRLPIGRKMLLEKGMEALDAGNAGAALTILQEAAGFWPKEPQIIFNLGRAYEAERQFDEAIKQYSLLQDNPDWQKKVTSAVERAGTRKRMEGNLDLTRNPELNNYLSHLSLSMGDMEFAFIFMNLAVYYGEQDIKHYLDLAWLRIINGEQDEAVRVLGYLERTVPGDPGLKKFKKWKQSLIENRNFREKIESVKFYMTLRDYRRAKETLEQLIREDSKNISKNAWVYSLLAQAEKELGLTEEAEEHRLKAVELIRQNRAAG